MQFDFPERLPGARIDGRDVVNDVKRWMGANPNSGVRVQIPHLPWTWASSGNRSGSFLTARSSTVEHPLAMGEATGSSPVTRSKQFGMGQGTATLYWDSLCCRARAKA
jgi:hypothetical protein